MLEIAGLTILAEGLTCKTLREDRDPCNPPFCMTQQGSRNRCCAVATASTPLAEPTGSPSRPSLFNKHPDDRSRCWPNSESQDQELTDDWGGGRTPGQTCKVRHATFITSGFRPSGINLSGRSVSRSLSAVSEAPISRQAVESRCSGRGASDTAT
jgi:hypothetical protein